MDTVLMRQHVTGTKKVLEEGPNLVRSDAVCFALRDRRIGWMN